jgi:5-hydroxyisourate hydrolase-like protein (transthyretin family)
MQYATTIRVLLEGSSSPLSNVKVALYDRDRLSRDDLLGTAHTDANGEVRIQYTTEDFADLEDSLRNSMPELYAVVYDDKDEVVLSTRSEASDNDPRKHMLIRVPQELAQSHRLVGA